MEERTEEIIGKIIFYGIEDIIAEILSEELTQAGFKTFISNNVEDAVNILETEHPDIILGDYKYSHKNISELLNYVKKHHPSVNRSIICEESDRPEVVNLLVKGIITNYFSKPDGFIFLLETLLHIIEVRQIMKNKELLKITNSITRLPLLPNIFQKFLNALENDKEIKEIASIIKNDISLTTKIIQIANSAFSRSGKIGSVERACVYLGMENIKNIVFLASASNMKKLSQKQANILERIIQHSLKTNQNFQRFYKNETGKKIPDEFASVGLTHDVGKIIILQFLPDRLKKIIKYQQKNPDISFYRSEIELGYEGCTHCEIGAYFLHLWNFPETNILSALYHHTPESVPSQYTETIEILELSDKFAREV